MAGPQTPKIKRKTGRLAIIKGVQTPLAFFVLLLLVGEALIAVVCGLLPEGERSWVVRLMFLFIFTLTGIVAYMACFRPWALYGKRDARGSEHALADATEAQSTVGGTTIKQGRDQGSSLKASFWPVWRDACLDEHEGCERVESCLYRCAQSSLKFMTISGRSIYSGGVEEMLKKKPQDFTMRLLLFDWNSPHYAAKMRDERREAAEDVTAAREKARDIARQFVKRSARLQCKVQVKLYSEYPVWRLLIVDHNLAYTGYYPAGKRGYEGPMVRFESSDETGLFYPMNQYFDTLWDSAGEPLQIHDSRFEFGDLPPDPS